MLLEVTKDSSQIIIKDDEKLEDNEGLLVIAIGTIVTDPVLNDSKKGTKWIKFQIKINNLEKPQRMFVKGFGEGAIAIDEAKLQKGDVVKIIGKPEGDAWEHNQSERIIKELNIIPEQIIYLGENKKIKDKLNHKVVVTK